VTPGARRAAGASLLIAAFLSVAPLLPGLIAGRSLWYRDVGQYYIPNRILTIDSIRSGALPLWNPLRGEGQPFLANPNSFVLRPTTLLYLPFPRRLVHVPMTLSVMALFAAAAAGTLLLLRDAGFSPAASLTGAVAFALSGPVQSLGQLQNHLEGVAFVPLTLFAFRRALLRGPRPWGLIAGLLFGLVVSAGEPVWIAVTMLASLALPAMEGAGPRRFLRAGSVAVVTGILLASAQLLPLLDNLGKSERGEGLVASEVMKWSLPPPALLQAIVPGLWGDPTRSSPTAYWGSGLFDSSLPWLLSIHLGAPIVLLAAFGFVSGLRKEGGRCGALGLLGVVLAIGRFSPIYPFLVRWVPGASSVRYPVKWLILTAWVVSLLAARGLDSLAGSGPSPARRSKLAVGSAASILFLLGLAASTGRLPGVGGVVRWLLHTPSSFTDADIAAGAVRGVGSGLLVAAGSILLLLVLLPRGEQGLDLRMRACAALCVGVLLVGAWGVNPSAPPEVVFGRSPLLDRMPGVSDGTLRFFGYPRPPGFAFRTPSADESAAAGLPPDSLAWGMRWDSRTLRNATYFAAGVHGAYDRLGDSRLDLLPGSGAAKRLGEGASLPETLRYLRAASAGYLLSYGSLDDPALTEVASLPGESNVPVIVYRIGAPAPRAGVVPSGIPMASPGEALGRVGAGGFDAAREVLIGPEGAEEAGAGTRDPGGETAGEARVTAEAPGEVRIHAEALVPSFLVLTDSFEPSWRADVDGAPASVLRANAMFRAVKIPPGSHEVRFTYRPASFRLGMALSTATLLLASILAFRGRRGAIA